MGLTDSIRNQVVTATNQAGRLHGTIGEFSAEIAGVSGAGGQSAVAGTVRVEQPAQINNIIDDTIGGGIGGVIGGGGLIGGGDLGGTIGDLFGGITGGIPGFGDDEGISTFQWVLIGVAAFAAILLLRRGGNGNGNGNGG